MNESHKSYSEDFEASTEDVDLIVQRSIAVWCRRCTIDRWGFWWIYCFINK